MPIFSIKNFAKHMQQELGIKEVTAIEKLLTEFKNELEKEEGRKNGTYSDMFGWSETPNGIRG